MPEDIRWKEVAAGRNIPSVLAVEQMPELEPQVVEQMQEPGQDTAIVVDMTEEQGLVRRTPEERPVVGRDTAVATMGNTKELVPRDKPHSGSRRELARRCQHLPTSRP